MDTPTPHITPQLTPQLMPHRASVADWCALSGMSRSGTYAALRAGHLQAVKAGRRTLLDVRAGLAWLDMQPPAEFSGLGGNKT